MFWWALKKQKKKSCWWGRNSCWEVTHLLRFEVTVNVSSLVCADPVWRIIPVLPLCVWLSLSFSCRSLPASHFTHTRTHTHTSPPCMPYYHAATQLGTRSLLLLGNFRRAILVHCLGLGLKCVCMCVCMCVCACVCVCRVDRERAREKGGEREWEYVWELFDYFFFCGIMTQEVEGLVWDCWTLDHHASQSGTCTGNLSRAKLSFG